MHGRSFALLDPRHESGSARRAGGQHREAEPQQLDVVGAGIRLRERQQDIDGCLGHERFAERHADGVAELLHPGCDGVGQHVAAVRGERDAMRAAVEERQHLVRIGLDLDAEPVRPRLGHERGSGRREHLAQPHHLGAEGDDGRTGTPRAQAAGSPYTRSPSRSADRPWRCTASMSSSSAWRGPSSDTVSTPSPATSSSARSRPSTRSVARVGSASPRRRATTGRRSSRGVAVGGAGAKPRHQELPLDRPGRGIHQQLRLRRHGLEPAGHIDDAEDAAGLGVVHRRRAARPRLDEPVEMLGAARSAPTDRARSPCPGRRCPRRLPTSSRLRRTPCRP